MASIDEVFQLVKYRSSKSGYVGTISSSDFNLIFPKACLRYYLKLFGNQNEYQYGNPIPKIAYPMTIKVSSSMSKFKTKPSVITIDSAGQFAKPIDLFFIDSISHIVTTDGGQILGSITAGTSYTNGTYTNITLTGGTGTGAKATITVAGAIVTKVTVTTNGTGYVLNNVLTTAAANIGGTGSGFLFTIQSIGTLPTPIKRVEEQDLADTLYSYIDYPTEMFPIYVEYSNYIQFYPINLQYATLAYLREPVTPIWNYTLNGTIATTNTLVGGASYVNGTYPNVPLTGGAGTGAFATITVAGGAVTNVVITNGGLTYKATNVLSASNAYLGGVGTGFSVTVATLSNARQVYNATGSVDPEFADFDLDEIIYMTLADVGAFLNSQELEGFANANMMTGGIK